MKRDDCTLTVLSNGVRALHIRCRHSAVGFCGLCIRAGSRDENSDEHGLAHFVEHTIFKGTPTLSSRHIINRMESVGGELNAYTTKEETVIYSTFPAGNLARAARLIGDIAANSFFPDAELDRERDVVAEEIDSYLDMPSEAVFDDFEDLIFKGSPLGHNILGDKKSLKHFDSRLCRRFITRNYTASRIVAFYSGAQPPSSVFSTFEKYFSLIPADDVAAVRSGLTPALVAPFDLSRRLHSHQAHCVIGSRIPGFLDDRRYAYSLIANILGGPGMNSLLNVQLRERRGLVYSVEASAGLFSDCGIFTIYFGSNPDDRDLCRRLIDQTVSAMPDFIADTRRLAAAKKQYLGQLVVASESRENATISSARSLLWRDRVISPDETADAIRTLTPDTLTDACLSLSSPSTLTFTSQSHN